MLDIIFINLQVVPNLKYLYDTNRNINYIQKEFLKHDL